MSKPRMPKRPTIDSAMHECLQAGALLIDENVSILPAKYHAAQHVNMALRILQAIKLEQMQANARHTND